MARTKTPKRLSALPGISLVSGLGFTAIPAPLYAQLSGVGSATTDLKIMQPVARTLVIYDHADVPTQLTLGMLLIVLGFFLHGLARMRDERPVHISVKPKKRKSWFWVELRV